MKPTNTYIAVCFVVVLCLAFPVSANLEEIDEGFGPQWLEDFDGGHVTLTPPASDEYTHTQTGTGTSFIASDQFVSGAQSWRLKPAAGQAIDATLSGMSLDLCDGGSIEFWVRLSAVGISVGFGPAATGITGINAMYLQDSAGNLQAGVSDNAGTGAIATIVTGYGLNTWYHFRWSNVNCLLGQVTVVEMETEGVVILDAPGQFTGNAMTSFVIDQGVGDITWIDDLIWPRATPGIWCSDSGNAGGDFDYDFIEQVSLDNAEVGIGIDPFYRFEGESDDYSFLGKSWTALPTKVTSYFRIEAQVEGADSNFRSAFSFIPATNPGANPTMDKGTGSTAGDSSGDFEEHLEVRFLESGNDWNIAFFQVSIANTVNVRTQLGVSTNTDNPNTPTSYAFELDTNGALTLYHVVDDELGEVVLTWLVNDGAAHFTGDAIREHWFVGFHTDVLPGDEHLVALDPDSAANLSTCLLAPVELAVNGGAGSTPSPPEPPGDPGGDPGGDSDLASSGTALGNALNIGGPGGQVLLAIVLILIFGGFAYAEFGKTVHALLIGGALGLVLTIFTSLMPPVVTFILVLCAALIAGMRIFSGSSSAEAM